VTSIFFTIVAGAIPEIGFDVCPVDFWEAARLDALLFRSWHGIDLDLRLAGDIGAKGSGRA
jgi:hypothetical protein